MFAAMTLALLVVAGGTVSQPTPAFWALIVNDAPRGQVMVQIDGDETWIPVAVLEKAGLRGFDGERRELSGEPHVRMRSLEPEISLQRDMVEVSLRLFAAPRFFAPTVIALDRDRPEGISYASTTSLYSNYAVDWDETAGTTGYGQTALSLFGNTTFQASYSVESDGTFVRGLSALTIDRRTARQRLSVGDTLTLGSPLGSSPTVGGIQFGRDYRLDPYYFRYPSESVRGTATTRSRVDVYINGTRRREFEIGPGPYRLDRLPIDAGLSNVRVVVRDPFGKEQVFDTAFYQSITVLRRGEQDYQYSAGRLRDDSADVPTYEQWAGAVSHRVGVTNWLTTGFSGEGDEHVVAGGPSLTLRLANLGDMHVEGWWTRTKEGTRGTGGYGTYAFIGRFLNVSALAQVYDDGFSNLFVAPGDTTAPEFYQLSVGVPVGFVGITYIGERKRAPAGNYGLTLPDGSFDAEKVRVRQHGLRLNVHLPFGAQLTVSARHTRIRDGQYWSGLAGLTVVMGRWSTASVNYTRQDDEETTAVDINRSLPVGRGFGYRINASDTDGGTGGAQFEVNTRVSRMRVKYDVFEGGARHNTAFNLSGGVAANKGGLFFTRPLDSSGAVVEVKGVRNVGILVDNVPVGRTGRNGRVLINDMLPFLANRVSFVEGDLPFEYTVPETSQLIAPPFRGAAYVLFNTKRLQARAGRVRLLVDGAEVVPSYGSIAVTVDGAPVESPINLEGEFFLDLPDGRHRATVTFKGATCQVSFVAAGTSGALIQQLGTLTCTP